MANVSQKWLNENVLKILTIFTRKYSGKIYGNLIAKKLKLPQRTVSRNLNKLCALNLLNYVREGKNKLYFVDKNNSETLPLFTLIESYKSTNFLLKNKKLGLMLKELSKLSGLIIFGSYAKGLEKEISDVDILFIGKNSKKISDILNKYNFKTQIHFSTLENFEKKLKEKNPLSLEILENHIIISQFDSFVKLFIKYG